MPMFRLESNYIKRANARTDYTKQQWQELQQCSTDPLYFIENFVRIQHPTRGSVPFVPYEFQDQMVTAYNRHRFNVSMCGRQMGKCSTYETLVLVNEEPSEIGHLIQRRTMRQRLVDFLERTLISLVKGFPN
jgi:hypothetical protein